MKAASKRYIGLMSGTSIDAMDGVLVDLSASKPNLLATTSISLPDELKERLHKLSTPGGENEVFNLGLASRDIGDAASLAVNDLVKSTKLDRKTIAAVGFHGQTIRHHPEHNFTLQIGDASRITEQTGITTVADFRSRDIAAGGQGAPLAPFFHQALCPDREDDTVILNIGGLANVTALSAVPDSTLKGFDTGPGNTLMDAWCRKHLQQPFDENGLWAGSGQVSSELLQSLLATPYFRQPPPKSTGRELFNPAWLQRQLQQFSSIRPEDVQATLLALTVQSITLAINNYASATQKLYICGGGTRNSFLMNELQQALPSIHIDTTQALGIDPQWIEATAFAWLAMQTMEFKAIHLPSITGAAGNRILGAIYPA